MNLKLNFLLLVPFLCLTASAAKSDSPGFAKDSLGRQVRTGAKRVISLSPALTEMIFSLELQNKIVGVSDFSDFPPKAKSLPSVGPYSKPNLEKIISLKPDLVLLPVEGPRDLQSHFDQLKIPYAVLSMKSLDEIGRAGYLVAILLENEKAGRSFETQWLQRLKDVFSKLGPKPGSSGRTPAVLIEIQNEPLIVAGQDTFMDESVTRCGGKNVFHGEKNYPRVSRELVVTSKIDVVLVADFFPDPKLRKHVVDSWRNFPATSGARVIVLDPDTATRPGPRLLEGIRQICTALGKLQNES